MRDVVVIRPCNRRPRLDTKRLRRESEIVDFDFRRIGSMLRAGVRRVHSKTGIDDSKGMATGDIIDVGDTEYVSQPLGGNFHRTW